MTFSWREDSIFMTFFVREDSIFVTLSSREDSRDSRVELIFELPFVACISRHGETKPMV